MKIRELVGTSGVAILRRRVSKKAIFHFGILFFLVFAFGFALGITVRDSGTQEAVNAQAENPAGMEFKSVTELWNVLETTGHFEGEFREEDHAQFESSGWDWDRRIVSSGSCWCNDNQIDVWVFKNSADMRSYIGSGTGHSIVVYGPNWAMDIPELRDARVVLDALNGHIFPLPKWEK